MSRKEVSAFITKLLCRNRGCMEYEEIYHDVRRRYSLSGEALVALLGDGSRFVVTGDRPQSRERTGPQSRERTGPQSRERTGPQSGAGSKVIAKTSVRLCPRQKCDGAACSDLHLCWYLVRGHCGRGKKCKYSHKVHSSHNSSILTEKGLQDLDQPELFLLLLQNDSCLLPDICSHYNSGSDKHGSCRYKNKCFELHICKHFLQGDCIFDNNCRRAHRFDEKSIAILKEKGFEVDLNSEGILYEIYRNRFMIASDLEKAAESWMSESSTMKVVAPNSSDICVYFILGQCRYKETCRNMHYELPYRWQILNSDGVTWDDHPNMEDVERAYSNPENDVREQTSEASNSSHTLEKNYLNDINGRVCISINGKEFIINFKEMRQQDHDNHAKTEVRRRPRFISASEVERKRSSRVTHS